MDEYDGFKKDAQVTYNEYSKHKWKIFWKILGVIVFLSVIGLVGKVVLFPLFVTSKIMDSAGKVIEKTVDADNVLYNYEWFKQSYRDYLAADIKIKNVSDELSMFKESAGERSSWSFEDKNEYSRLSATRTGLRNYREDIVAQYNARSKMLNRKIFKGKDVPYELN